MNGPRHYAEAERLLADAQVNRAIAESEGSSRSEKWLSEAEFDMKAAHVHAMLAVAAATIDAPRNAPEIGQEYGSRPQEWAEVLA